MLTMGARQALYACLMLASTMLAVSHAAAQKLPARDLDVLGPGSFSHSLANTQREQAAAQLQASGVKVTPLSAAAGTITAGAPAAAAKPTSGTTSPAAAAKAGAKYGATDKFAYGDDDYFYIDIYRRSDPNAPKFTLGEYFNKLLNEMQEEVDAQDHDFEGPKYVYPKPGSGYHGSSEHHGGDSYHHSRRYGSHSYDAPHHHSYGSRQGDHGQQHYKDGSYHGHEEYRQQRDSYDPSSYGQYSEGRYGEGRYGDEEEQYNSGSGYDEPKRTTYSFHGSYEDVCVRETARSQCETSAAHGYIYTSSLACCHKHQQQYYEDQHYEDQHYEHERHYSDAGGDYHHRKHSVSVASTPSHQGATGGADGNQGVAAKVSGSYSNGPRMFYPRGGNSECVWNVDYLDDAVQVNQHTQQIGMATATCHFNASTVHCGSPLCEGMTITISGDVYQTTNVVTKFGPKYPSATAPSIAGTCVDFDLGFDNFTARLTAGSSKQASAKLGQELPATPTASHKKPAAAAAHAPAPVAAAKPPVETKTVYVNVPVPTPVPTPVYVYVPSPAKAPEAKADSKQPAATVPQPTGPATQPQPQPQSGPATATPAAAQPSSPANAPGKPAAGTTAPSKPAPARPAKYAEYRGSKQAVTQGKRAPLRPLARSGGNSRAVAAAAVRIQRYGDQEYFTERSANFVESVTPTGLYSGRATILVGVVTSVTGLEKGVEYHRGMIEHVVYFEGTELSAVAYEALPYDTPHVTPGAYKIVFMGEDHHDKQY